MSPKHPSQSHFRFDPLFGDWVIFAPARETRPDDYDRKNQSKPSPDACPFCVGQESKTPPSLWVGKASDSTLSSEQRETSEQMLCHENWRVRVFRNRYPAIAIEKKCVPEQNLLGTFSNATISGGHEVIVDTRSHTDRMCETSITESRLLIRAIRDRIIWWHRQKDIKYVSVFKNCGASAGASLHHSHCQLIATNHFSKQTQTLFNRSRLFSNKTGHCLLCKQIDSELADLSRAIYQGKHLTAYCPYASRFPMQVRIAPRDHQAKFEESPSDTLDEVALVIRRSVLALQHSHPHIAYNLIFSNLPPKRKKHERSFHWSIDLCPRPSSIAGFEIATGNMINCVLPEKAAELYRSQFNLQLMD